MKNETFVKKGSENVMSADNQQERLLFEKNPQRLYAKHLVTSEDRVRPSRRLEEMYRNVYPPSMMVSTLTGKVTDMSEMPCRLNDGLHEWCNEIATVPT